MGQNLKYLCVFSAVGVSLSLCVCLCLSSSVYAYIYLRWHFFSFFAVILIWNLSRRRSSRLAQTIWDVNCWQLPNQAHTDRSQSNPWHLTTRHFVLRTNFVIVFRGTLFPSAPARSFDRTLLQLSIHGCCCSDVTGLSYYQDKQAAWCAVSGNHWERSTHAHA